MTNATPPQNPSKDIPLGMPFFQSLLDCLNDSAIIMCDLEGRINYWSPGAASIFGYAAEEVLEHPITVLLTPEDRDANTAQHEMDAALVDGRYSEDRWFLHRDGSRRFINCITHAVSNGHLNGFVRVMRDETARKQDEIELTEARLRADAANLAKDHFLAVLSHELRTPLTPALATLAQLQSDSSLPEHLKHDIEVVRRNVELEARIIDDLLDYTRIARGKLHLNTASVDLHSLVGHALEICRSEVFEKKINLSVDLNAEKHFVRGDAIRLQQVLWNLIKNAVKFTPSGGHITIHSFNTLDGRLKIKVSDSGIGIDPQRLPHIFGAFVQGETSITRQFGGLGLGLAIAKTLVELHDGALSAESKGMNEGSSFTIDLPTTSDAVRVVSQIPPRDPAERFSRPLRILLVEDHVDTARIMARLLRGDRHQVDVAHNIVSALLIHTAREFDVMISDIGLPDGTGYELLAKVSEKKTIPSIALTGFGMEEDIQKSVDAGFMAHLTKPINFQRLGGLLRQIAQDLDSSSPSPESPPA